MGPRPPDAEMGHDAVASGRCVNELSGALCLWTVCGVVPGCLHTVRGYRTATGLWQAWPPHRASATPATRRSFFIDIFTRTKIKHQSDGQAVFMRRACAPTPPPRWPAAHSARRSAAHAANAPRAAPSHTSRARSPPTRAPTPPLFYDPSHVDKFPAPKALIPT